MANEIYEIIEWIVNQLYFTNIENMLNYPIYVNTRNKNAQRKKSKKTKKQSEKKT